jgi:GNAT superfamily N-acetyltransferase
VAQVRPLAPDEIAQAWSLSNAVGWNQTPGDWARLLALAPRGLYGGFADGRLVATSSIVTYGDALAWVGMMVVDAEHRGKGLGRRLLDAALHSPTVAPGAVVGLDATDMGVPLYRARDFVAVDPIDRWCGVLRPTVGTPSADVRPAEASDAPTLAAWDATHSGTDRADLLTHLLLAPGALAWIATHRSDVAGYAVVRPGRTRPHLGPLVAVSDAARAALLAAAADRLSGAEVFADVVRSRVTDEVFAAAGLRVARRLVRMTRGRPQRVLCGGPVSVTAGFEWG